MSLNDGSLLGDEKKSFMFYNYRSLNNQETWEAGPAR
jgi:hypothetical protein